MDVSAITEVRHRIGTIQGMMATLGGGGRPPVAQVGNSSPSDASSSPSESSSSSESSSRARGADALASAPGTAPSYSAVAAQQAANMVAQTTQATGGQSVGGVGTFSKAVTDALTQARTTPQDWPAVNDRVKQWTATFKLAGQRHGVDPKLLAAVAQTESGGNPFARSSAGALGIMQFMPATAKELGVDPMDPSSAIDGAARLLKKHLAQFGSVDLALAAYNAGAGAVSRHGGIPPYAETQAYVTKVQDLLKG